MLDPQATLPNKVDPTESCAQGMYATEHATKMSNPGNGSLAISFRHRAVGLYRR